MHATYEKWIKSYKLDDDIRRMSPEPIFFYLDKKVERVITKIKKHAHV